jgi:hypothetical protein
LVWGEEEWNVRIPENYGFFFLSAYLILQGLVLLTGGDVTGAVLGLLALLAGIFILLNYIRVQK